MKTISLTATVLLLSHLLMAQNVGIGTTSPTAGIDINTTLRIRGSSVKAGSVLTSLDVNGNAEWTRPFAFKATGGIQGVAVSVPNNTWTKILFSQEYSQSSFNHDVENGYNNNTSEFVVSKNGIYNFSVQLHWDNQVAKSSVRIRVKRPSGTVQTLGERYEQEYFASNGTIVTRQSPSSITISGALVEGDIVWVEGFAVYNGPSITVNANPGYSWFAGHLITRY